jgi:hypothetical protein
MQPFNSKGKLERVLIRVVTDDEDALNGAIERMRLKAFDDVSRLEIEGKLSEAKDALVIARAFEKFSFVHGELDDISSRWKDLISDLESRADDLDAL